MDKDSFFVIGGVYYNEFGLVRHYGSQNLIASKDIDSEIIKEAEGKGHVYEFDNKTGTLILRKESKLAPSDIYALKEIKLTPQDLEEVLNSLKHIMIS